MNAVQENLLKEAEKMTLKSYSPYSNFRVGAAVLANGNIFGGTNIENASSNLGICAERVAISNALCNNSKNISGIAVFCKDIGTTLPVEDRIKMSMPCGACRQWISELAPNAWIVTNGSDRVYQISDLLPIAFYLGQE